MSAVDFPDPLPDVWPSSVFLNANGTTGPRLRLLNPRLQFYWGKAPGLVSSFQAAHVLAFGSVLTPSHYFQELCDQLQGDDLPPDRARRLRHHIANRGEGWGPVVREYLDWRGLLDPLLSEARSLTAFASTGDVQVWARPVVYGRMTNQAQPGPRQMADRAYFMDNPIDLFGNHAGPVETGLHGLLFNLNDKPFSDAVRLHSIRFAPAEDAMEAPTAESQPTPAPDTEQAPAPTAPPRGFVTAFITNPDNLKRAGGMVSGAITQDSMARAIAAMLAAEGVATSPETVGALMRSKQMNAEIIRGMIQTAD
jgi:hypothetical protein